MADDIARSLSALQTLLADNTSQQISAQDIRDFLVSALGEYGGWWHDTTQSSQTVSTAAKYTPNQAITAFPVGGNVTVSTTGGTKARITVGTTGTYLLVFSTVVANTSNNNLLTVQWYKGGGTAVSPATTLTWSAALNGYRQNAVCFAVAGLTAGEYVEVFMALASGSDSILLGPGAFFVLRLE